MEKERIWTLFLLGKNEIENIIFGENFKIYYILNKKKLKKNVLLILETYKVLKNCILMYDFA